MSLASHATKEAHAVQLVLKSLYLLSSPESFSRGSPRAIIFWPLALPILDKAAREGSGVDVFQICTAVAAEIMSAYEFGLECGLDLTSEGREAVRKRHVENGRRKLRESEGWEQAAKDLEDECFEMCLKVDKSRSAGETEGNLRSDAEGSVHEGSSLQTATRPLIFAQLEN